MSAPTIHPAETAAAHARDAADRPRVSIAIPLFNEKPVVPELLRRVTEVLDRLPGGPHELVVVDDGSRDRTFELLSSSAALLIMVPAFRAIWTRHDDLNHHQTRYTKATLLPLVQAAGFTISRARYYFQWLFAVKLVVRQMERLRPGEPQVPQVPGRVVNEAVFRVSLAEQAVAGAVPLPFGSSLLVVAGKPR